jgi:hypothetical protein
MSFAHEFVAVSVSFACLVACGASNPPASEPSTPGQTPSPGPAPGPSAVPPAATPAANNADDACEADGDCVALEMACCDHCNGGSLAAFNRARADKHKRTGCEEVQCTMRACGAAIAKCVDHHCKADVQKLGPGL